MYTSWCQQFGKRSENVKGKLCLKVIIAIFPWLTIVLSFRDVAKTAFWVNWNRGTWPSVATALHHFPAYATDLSADLDVWKDENEIWRSLRLRMAYSSGFQPAGHRSILWWARAIWVIVNSVKAVGPVREWASTKFAVFGVNTISFFCGDRLKIDKSRLS